MQRCQDLRSDSLTSTCLTLLRTGEALGITDCTGYRMFRRWKKILSKPCQSSEEVPFSKGISLTLVVAVLPSLGAAEAVMPRIKAARKVGGVFVDSRI